MANLNMITPLTVQGIINKFCFTIGMLPTSYKESLTYEEQILCIGKYLEGTVYPAINNNAQALEELQELFIALQDYVNNYFDNLDVQEEINNKLDDMAESGHLQNIIAAYLETKAIFAFATVADLKAAENLDDGTYAKTMGYYSISDGGASIYRIRTMTNEDVIDEMIILAMTNNNSLVAELVHNDTINLKQLGSIGDNEEDESQRLITALSIVNKVIIPSGTYRIADDIDIPRNNISIVGNSYRDTTLVFDFGYSMSFEGTTLTQSGTHKDFFTLQNLKLQAQNYNDECETPFLKLICCSYVYIINCWIAGKGKQVLLWECFDSRFLNTDVEWGGSATDANVMGIELRSTNGGDNSLATYEYTNNIYFQGCRFESHVGTCIGSTGNNTNKIIFESCKFESFNCLSQNAISFKHCATIYFTNCIIAGELGNTKNYLLIDDTNDFKITGFCEHKTAHSMAYSGKRLIYASGSGNRVINIGLNNSSAYTLDQTTFGIDSWDNNIYINGDIHVNNIHNKNILVTPRKTSIATLTSGSTTLDYDVLDNGFIHISCVGTYGETTPQKITIKDNTTGMECTAMTIGSLYNTAIMPVAKGDNLTCTGNTTATAYLTIYYNRN